jgi:hypothetical protein
MGAIQVQSPARLQTALTHRPARNLRTPSLAKQPKDDHATSLGQNRSAPCYTSASLVLLHRSKPPLSVTARGVSGSSRATVIAALFTAAPASASRHAGRPTLMARRLQPQSKWCRDPKNRACSRSAAERAERSGVRPPRRSASSSRLRNTSRALVPGLQTKI